MESKEQKLLEEILNKDENIMLGKELCPYTKATRDVLDQRGITYKYYPKESNPELIQAISTLYEGKTFPQVFLKKQYIGGLNEIQIHYNGNYSNYEE